MGKSRLSDTDMRRLYIMDSTVISHFHLYWEADSGYLISSTRSFTRCNSAATAGSKRLQLK